MDDKSNAILNFIRDAAEDPRPGSVWTEVASIDDNSDEDLPVTLNGQHCVSARIGFGYGELYDVYVVKI